MAAKNGGKTFFCKKLPVDSADTLWVKTFFKITLSHSVSKMLFCVLCKNSRWPPKVAGKRFFGKVATTLCRYPVGQKFRRNRSISLCFRFFAFYAEIQDGHQQWQEIDFWGKLQEHFADTLWVKNFVDIALSRSDSAFLRFMQKFKMATKSGRKTIFLGKLQEQFADTLWVKNFIEIALSRSVSEINMFLQIF